MPRSPHTRALAGLTAGAFLVVALSGCAAKPEDSNTSNGITPGPPPPSGMVLPTPQQLPTNAP